MSPLIKDLYEKANKQNLDAVDENALKEMGYSTDQIQDIIQEFVKNQPKQIWKVGDCPRCGSSVDNSYDRFDQANFQCDCRLDFTGLEAEDTQAFIRLK